MKKYLILLLVVLAVPVFAQEDYAVNLNLGNIGFGGNFPLKDIHNAELVFSLINVGVEHKGSNVGIGFSPFQGYYWANREEETTDVYSFINVNLYWNLLNHSTTDSIIYFGPFTSINYLFLEGENINYDRYIFTAGVQLGWRINLDGINYNIVSTEVGFRNIDGQNRFYVGAKLDIVACFLTIVLINSLTHY